jgi:hypothetical protein
MKRQRWWVIAAGVVAGCTPSSLTLLDVFTNEAVGRAQTTSAGVKSGVCPPFTCPGGECTGTLTRRVPERVTIPNCAIKDSAGSSTVATGCTTSSLAFQVTDAGVRWVDPPRVDAGTLDLVVERGSLGFAFDTDGAGLLLTFPLLADGSNCSGVTMVALSDAQASNACLFEIVTDPSGCVPRAQFVLSGSAAQR